MCDGKLAPFNFDCLHNPSDLYNKLYNIFFKVSSANDTGTVCANMNMINNCNAKTSNALDNLTIARTL